MDRATVDWSQTVLERAQTGVRDGSVLVWSNDISVVCRHLPTIKRQSVIERGDIAIERERTRPTPPHTLAEPV
ncbi:hypothetical protein BDK88_3272 [Natrinema hispanicum]|uniref:Uncharacterized protein n=1 Tax=Natrinema hispanicum TaxID=392421 RepID=A0A482Y8J8_9EURY|nr:hypothetical protein BDK88_3272 [Natrinema hispanicum]